MKKEWFIFRGTHHHGPYSLAELVEFLKSEELSTQSLIWKEGSEKWEAVAKIPEVMTAFEGPVKKAEPALPELPSDDDEMPPMPPPSLSPKQTTKQKAPIEEMDDELPPPIPLDALLQTKTSIGEPKAKPSPRNWRAGLFAMAALLLIGLIAWFAFFEPGKTSIKIKGLMPVYLERLQETAESKSPAIMFSLALSLDGKTIWVSTNKSGVVLAKIKLTSLPKRVLGQQTVVVLTQGVIRDHVGKFDRMDLLEGNQFTPGEYKVHLEGRKIHFLNEKFPFLNSFSFTKKLNSRIKYEGDALIYSGIPREFEKKLIDYHSTMLNEKLKPFQDKLERLTTFQSLLNQTAENYLLTLDKIKKGSEMNDFETQYQQNVSPIIQNLVLAAHDISNNPAFKEDFRNPIAPYKDQIQLGKQIGEMASDMITETRKLKKVSEKDKAQLKSKFESRYRTIKVQIDLNIKLLNEQIKKLSL